MLEHEVPLAGSLVVTSHLEGPGLFSNWYREINYFSTRSISAVFTRGGREATLIITLLAYKNKNLKKIKHILKFQIILKASRLSIS